MIIDCDRCTVRGPVACADCVVTVLLGGPPGDVELGPAEQQAIEALSGVGLVPPLRLVTDPRPRVEPPERRAAGFD